MPATAPVALKGYAARVRAFRESHAKAEIAVFFTAGFLFDIITLSRIDDWITLVQQGAYLVVLGGLMALDQRYEHLAPPRWLAKLLPYAEDAIHFLFGSLLSSFTLFYLKSASELSAVGFLAFLCILLIGNELPTFRKRGPVIRFALYSLCLTSYFAYLLPVLLGFMSAWLFLVSVVLSSGLFYLLARALFRWTHQLGGVLKRVVLPGVVVQGVLVGLYFAKAIPPVPLSVQYMGIYHEIVPPKRAAPAPKPPAQAAMGAPAEPAAPPLSPLGGRAEDRQYQLLHQRPGWKFWLSGDQEFFARPGDVIHVFARVFAPNAFKDEIFAHWAYKNAKGKWVSHGRAQLAISGGRGNGFRTFATKAKYQPGVWRVEIETEDGRDLGVLGFNVYADATTEPRVYQIDRF